MKTALHFLALIPLLSPVTIHAAGVPHSMNKNTSSAQSTYSKPTAEELKKKLTPMQFQCTQNEGTEKPFDNPYWNNKEDGIYVDVVTGEPLFSSKDKYDSGTGWPSFTKPIEQGHILEKSDRKMGVERTELRSKSGDSHLGHVFDDGPADKGGKRFCINSASLKFIPLKNLKSEGYEAFLPLFSDSRSKSQK